HSDLLRLLGLYRYRSRCRQNHGFRADAQFPAALSGAQHQGVLATLAYIPFHLVPRLRLFPSWRIARIALAQCVESHGGLRREWSVARGGLDLRDLGPAPWNIHGVWRSDPQPPRSRSARPKDLRHDVDGTSAVVRDHEPRADRLGLLPRDQ